MKFAAFDIEGAAGGEGIKGVAIYCDIIQTYVKDSSMAIEILRDLAKQKYTLIAHNAEYDTSVLFWQHKEPVEMEYYGERFNHAKWYFAGNARYCQIWDTLGLSGMLSLAQIGKSLGIEKYETPQRLLGKDPDKFDWSCEKHKIWECETCYAIRDAEICYKYMESYTELLSNYGIKPKRTMGSAAVAMWQAMDAVGSCHLPSLEYALFARESYAGGRVECFKVGQILPCYTADVKSMYPSVMIDTPMPDPKTLQYNEYNKPFIGLLELEGVSDATIEVPKMYVPPLPYRHDDKLYFPCGRLRGTWTHIEIRHAIEHGCRVITLHRTLYSTTTVFPFTQYITSLMYLRDEFKRIGDSRQLTVKIMLNSLYGRLGMNDIQTIEHQRLLEPGKDFSDYQGYTPNHVGDETYLSIEKTKNISSRYANVLWASYITSAARVKLHKYLVMQGDGLIYTDTDSIFSNRPIEGLGTELGELLDEGYYSKATIIAPKLYRLEGGIDGDKLRAKGVPRKVAEQFIREGKATFMKPIKPREARKRGIEAGVWVEMTKHWKSQPGKRHVIDPLAQYTENSYSDTVSSSFPPDVEDASNNDI